MSTDPKLHRPRKRSWWLWCLLAGSYGIFTFCVLTIHSRAPVNGWTLNDFSKLDLVSVDCSRALRYDLLPQPWESWTRSTTFHDFLSFVWKPVASVQTNSDTTFSLGLTSDWHSRIEETNQNSLVGYVVRDPDSLEVNFVLSQVVTNHYDGGILQLTYGSVWPRRQSTLEVRAEFQTPWRGREQTGFIPLSMGRPPHYPQWAASPFPVKKVFDGRVIEMQSLKSGLPWPGMIGTEGIANRTTSKLTWTWEKQGSNPTNALVAGIEISDATGNRWRPRLSRPDVDYRMATDGKTVEVQLAMALPRSEKTWRVSVEWFELDPTQRGQGVSVGPLRVPAAWESLENLGVFGSSSNTVEVQLFRGAQSEIRANTIGSWAALSIGEDLFLRTIVPDRAVLVREVVDDNGQPIPILDFRWREESCYTLHIPIEAREIKVSAVLARIHRASFDLTPEWE